MDVQNCTSRLSFSNNSEDQSNGILETQYGIDKISEEFEDKLQIRKSENNGPLNGCSKVIYEDSKHVINGLLKYHNLERITNHECPENVNSCSSVESSCNSHVDTNDSDSNYVLNHQCSSNLFQELTDPSITESSSSETLATAIESDIVYIGYESEKQMPDIMRLIQKDLSEPYSIYTYRYFIHNWPKLCFLAHHKDRCVGAIVCKLDVHKKHSRRGYIAMLAVDEMYRKRKIGSNLVLKAIKAMMKDNADEVVLETEITNKSALRLYENLGFVRDKRLFRYYLNGVDALRLKLWIR